MTLSKNINTTYQSKMKTITPDHMEQAYAALATLDFDKIHADMTAANIQWLHETGGYSTPSASQIRWVARNLLMLTLHEAVLSKTVCELSSRGFAITATPALSSNASVRLSISFKI